MNRYLLILHASRAPELVNDQVLCRAVICRFVRSSGRGFYYLASEH